MALYWLSTRVLSGVLAAAGRYGSPPPAAGLLQTATSALAFLPIATLAALWLRDLGGAPVPPLPQLVRAVLGAWGWIAAAILLAAVVGAVALLVLRAAPLQLAAAGYWSLSNPLLLHDLALLVLWLICVPLALARFCGRRWLPARSAARAIASLAILAAPAGVDLADRLLLGEALLFVDPLQQPWHFLALHYAQACSVALAFALALLAVWRLNQHPGLRRAASAA